MSDHYIAIDQAIQGTKQSDFTVGTTSTAGTHQMEFRVADGAGLTKNDVHLALEAFLRWFENAQWVAPTGFDVKL